MSTDQRQFDYGLPISVFFLSWFLGAAYISRLSDYVGRKLGILICLLAMGVMVALFTLGAVLGRCSAASSWRCGSPRPSIWRRRCWRLPP